MEYREFIKKSGLKVTRARIFILEMLSKSTMSLSAEDIYGKCKNIGLNINLSTVYRCLESFEEHNIVDKFSNIDGICSYKIKGDEHKHMLTCSICHKEIEISCPMKQFDELVERETGFTVTEHNLQIKGVCENCKNKSKK